MEPKYSILANFMNGEATYTIFLQIKSEWPTSRDAIATTVSGSQLINIQCRGHHRSEPDT